MMNGFQVLIRRSIACALLCFFAFVSAHAQTASPSPSPTSKTSPRRPLPKLSNGVRGFDSKSKASGARLIAIGGGYGAGEDEEPPPRLRRKTALGYFQWGDELYNRGMMNEAVVALEMAVKLNPSFVKAYWRLGNAYAEYNNLVDDSKYDTEECWRRAIIAFENVRRLQPKRAGAYNNLGVLYFNTDQFEKAVAAFLTGLRLKKKAVGNDLSLSEGEVVSDRDILMYIGDAYERLNKFALALDYYLRAKRDEIGMPDVIIDFRMARVYEKLADTENALKAYEAIDLSRTVYDIDGTDIGPDIRSRLGVLYAMKQDDYRAAEFLNKAIAGLSERLRIQKEGEPTELDPPETHELWLKDVQAAQADVASASYNLGVVYLNVNKAEDAIKAFQKTVEFEPANAEARFNLGFALNSIGEKPAALVQFEALKKIDPEMAQELEALLSK